MALLEIKNLETHFRTKRGIIKAVNDASYTVEEGKTLGIVGESGSGKSVSALSVLKLLDGNGFIAGGQILLEGRDITHLSLQEMYKIRGNDISMIFQEPMTSLNPLFTVERQVAETFIIHQGMKKAEARKKVVDILRDVKIPNPEIVAKQYPYQLSGGMRQRVMIAMALACKPKLLIADVPTTALDVTIQAQILDLIGELQKSENMSVVLITHDLGVVASLCHRVCVMYGGMIMEEVSLDDIFYRTAHPYTEALLGSIPARALENGTRLIPIKGYAPSLLNLPPGCPFAPRCPKKTPICDDGIPDMVPIAPGHCVRCVLYREVNHG